jgi:hypothetical protein
MDLEYKTKYAPSKSLGQKVNFYGTSFLVLPKLVFSLLDSTMYQMRLEIALAWKWGYHKFTKINTIF